jgi:hypothetical protein
VSLLPLPDLPPALVSPEGVDALEAVAGRFVSPAGILIECPLGEAGVPADLSLSFSRPAHGGDARIMADGWPAGTAWDRVRRFIDVWRDPGGPLWHEVQSLWLEFDLRRREPAPLPNVFFGHRAGLRSRATMLAGLDVLLDGDAPPARTLASEGLGALPPAANVLFAGVMLARRPPAIRFCVDGPPWQDAPLDLIQMARHVVVQLEADASAANRIGYELYHGPRQRGRAATWRPLLDRLVELGAARADRCAAALEWPGYAYDGSTDPRVVDRWINHVKVTCEAGAVIEAKVYLQFAAAWEPAASDAGGAIG